MPSGCRNSENVSSVFYIKFHTLGQLFLRVAVVLNVIVYFNMGDIRCFLPLLKSLMAFFTPMNFSLLLLP